MSAPSQMKSRYLNFPGKGHFLVTNELKMQAADCRRRPVFSMGFGSRADGKIRELEGMGTGKFKICEEIMKKLLTNQFEIGIMKNNITKAKRSDKDK